MCEGDEDTGDHNGARGNDLKIYQHRRIAKGKMSHTARRRHSREQARTVESTPTLSGCRPIRKRILARVVQSGTSSVQLVYVSHALWPVVIPRQSTPSASYQFYMGSPCTAVDVGSRIAKRRVKSTSEGLLQSVVSSHRSGDLNIKPIEIAQGQGAAKT